MDEIQRRKEELLKKVKSLKDKKSYIIWIIFAAIAYFGYYIRTLNLGLLKDATTGKYIPLALDPHIFLKYARYLLEHGHLMVTDTMRYHPFGYSAMSEFKLLTNVIVYFYKILHAFSSTVTLEYAHVLYPAVAFVIGLIFFFLFVRKLFDWRVALIASGFLSVIPTYLYRTMAGFSDKEAFAMVLLFAGMYFYVTAWKEKLLWKNILFGALAGISTGALGLVWGGVNFMFLTLGAYALICIAFNRFRKIDYYIYVSWIIPMVLVLHYFYPERFTWGTIMFSTTSFIMFFAAFAGLVNLLFFQNNYLNLKSKFKDKLPLSFAAILVSLGAGVIVLLFIKGPSFFISLGKDIFINLANPTITSRWILTVAESHQPYFIDWISQMGWKYVWLFVGGSVLLFYDMMKPFGKKALYLASVYAVFIIVFITSRYSQSSTFNGETALSQFTYLGSLAGFFIFLIWVYLKAFYNDKSLYKKVKEIDRVYIFAFVWFLLMTIAARTAVRLLFVFSPVTTVLIAYLAVRFLELGLERKEMLYKAGVIIAVVLLFGTIFVGFSKSVMGQAKYTGPSYNQQWQYAMDWVRDNTPEDAIFAHWWDYGYWVQAGGERTTLSDGGNALGAINHFMGRHVLTAQSDTEALEFLKARDASHLLMIVDEVGKYPAFSSIGADANYDRYSWIPTFHLDVNRIQEKRDQTVYLFTGGTPLDDDLIYGNKLYPAQAAGIGGFFVPVQETKVQVGNNTVDAVNIFQPKAVVFHAGQQAEVPLECVYYNGKRFEFKEKGLPGCLRIIPSIENNGMGNPLGAALYLAPDVKNSLFARLFLMDEKNDYFKLAYSDESGMPLAVYMGRLVGPLKIWEISYPDDLDIPPEYYGTTLPDPNVDKIRK